MNTTKATALGMPYGTASARLLKAILFDLIVKTEQNCCFRCSKSIDSTAEMSIEHKAAWQAQDDPVAAFFDLDNIAFSHRSCNYRAAARPHAKNRSPDEVRANWAARKRRNYTKEKRHSRWVAKRQ